MSNVWNTILAHWNPDFAPYLVGLFRIGSHSHGTYIPPEDDLGIDDVDYMAIVIPPPSRVLGLRQFEHEEVRVPPLDVVIYEWGKYVRLLLKSNPNVLGTLWLEADDIVERSPVYDELVATRSAFASQRAHAAFAGYAKDQLYKMTHCAALGYLGAKRKKLVERFGYDTKNAAHLIRLLQMCSEFLETGTLSVRRPDADMLKAIKTGQWDIERVEAYATELFGVIDKKVERSSLPKYPDEAGAERILLRGYLQHAWPNSLPKHRNPV